MQNIFGRELRGQANTITIITLDFALVVHSLNNHRYMTHKQLMCHYEASGGAKVYNEITVKNRFYTFFRVAKKANIRICTINLYPPMESLS